MIPPLKVRLILIFVTTLFILPLCRGKNISVEELIIGKWAVTGNDCDSEGRCRDLYKFLGKDFYSRNSKSMVLEFRTGGFMFQPILGDGLYRFRDGKLDIGINIDGNRNWNESELIFLTMDEMVIRFKKNWRRYRRIN